MCPLLPVKEKKFEDSQDSPMQEDRIIDPEGSPLRSLTRASKSPSPVVEKEHEGGQDKNDGDDGSSSKV